MNIWTEQNISNKTEATNQIITPTVEYISRMCVGELFVFSFPATFSCDRGSIVRFLFPSAMNRTR